MKARVLGFTAFFALIASLGTTPQARAAGTFVYCSEGSPSTFNPQIATDGTTFNATRGVYNRLAEFTYGETTIVPGLAESWKVSADGKTYTFKLRKGVKFHSNEAFKATRDFNADDVLFSFNRQLKKDHPYNKVNGGSYEYFDSMEMGKLIKDIKKVDDLTVVFELNTPEAPFLANMAMDFASILSAEYADLLKKEGDEEKIDFEPIGTGPFVFERYQKDQMIRYSAFKEHYRGVAKIEKLVFAITPDPSVRFQKLKAGECHLVTEPAPADLAAMKATRGLKVIDKPGLNVGYLSFNVKKKPFDDVRVRQALGHALNRKAYIDAIYLGNAVVAKNPMPPTIWGYAKGTSDYDYNPEKAKALLKQAGLEKGFDVELWTLPVSRPYNPNGRKMGEMMQADLAKVGVRAKLVTYDWPTYLEKSKNGEHQMLQMGWTGDNGDPDNFLFTLLSCAAADAGANRSFWCDAEFDKLVTQAKRVSARPARSALYEKAQMRFKKEAPWATLAHSVVYRAMSDKVKGFKIDPLGGDYFYEVDLVK
ncbi:MAG: ABC transporter substrate-binding protein [Bdellovibrionales bacterium]|nr:ABC transporter substrate-binding protein [Bdellovibrionales bacterium]